MDDHLEELALAAHILAHIRVLLGLLLVDDLDGDLLARERVQALLDLGERALAQLAAEQVVAHALVVREAGYDLLRRDQEVGRYDDVLSLQSVLAGIVYVVI